MHSIPERDESLVFIHGLADFSKSWRRLRDWLEPEGYRLHFFDYPTFNNALRIENVAAELYEYIQLSIGDEPFRILAHSQGGLIAEWMDLFYPVQKNCMEILTIATPYQGIFFPLIARQWLDYLPFSRNQIQHLCSFSSTLQQLIRRRLEIANHPTPYFTFIGYYTHLFGIESDMAVSVCEANRNFIAYRLQNHTLTELPAPETKQAMVHAHHLPLGFLRSREDAREAFKPLLLNRLNGGEPVSDYHPPLRHAAVILPQSCRKQLRYSSGIREVHALTTSDPSYRLLFIEIQEEKAAVFLNHETLRVQPGQFTYVFSEDFFEREKNQAI